MDFSSLPRSIQKYVPFQKIHIKGNISKKPSQTELISKDITFKIFALFKSLNLFNKVSLNQPKFTIIVEKKNGSRVSVPYLNLESEVKVNLANPIELYLQGKVENDVLLLEGKTTKEWNNPFGILPRLSIKEISSKLELSFSGRAYYLFKGKSSLFGRNLDVNLEVENNVAYLAAETEKLNLKEIAEFSSSIQGGSNMLPLLNKVPIDMEVHKASLTLSSSSGTSRSGREIKKGLELKTSTKVTVFELFQLDDVSCNFLVNTSGVVSACGIQKPIQLGPITLKQTNLLLTLFKNHQGIGMDSLINLFDITDLEIQARVSRIDGKVHWGFSAKPKNFELSKIRGFPSGPFNKLNLAQTSLYYSTHGALFESNIKIPSGVSVLADIDLTKNGEFFERIYNVTGMKRMGFYSYLGDVLSNEIDLRRIQLGSFVELRFRNSKFFEAGTLQVEFGIQPPSCSFKGSIFVVIPRTGEKLKFTGEFTLKTTGSLEVSATLEGKWNPFGLKFIEINAAALTLGIHPATIAITGPSRIGAAGKLKWKSVGDIQFGLLVDTIDAGQSLIHAKYDKISSDNILQLIETNIIKRIPDISINNLLIHIAPFGGKIGEIVFEKGMVLKGELQVLGKILKGEVHIQQNGFKGKAELSDIKFGRYLQLKNIQFSVAMSLTDQHLRFNGEIIILSVEKRILLDISLRSFKFETSLKTRAFSYYILAESEGTLMNPTDFLLEIKWESDMIRKFEEMIRKIVSSKMTVINRLKGAIRNTIQKIGSLGKKIEDLTKRLRNFICTIPGIRELCQKLKIEIDDSKEELEKEREMLEKEQRELDKFPKTSEFFSKNYSKFTISKVHFKIRLSQVIGIRPLNDHSHINVEFETVIENVKKNVLLENLDIEDPFQQHREDEFSLITMKSY